MPHAQRARNRHARPHAPPARTQHTHNLAPCTVQAPERGGRSHHAARPGAAAAAGSAGAAGALQAKAVRRARAAPAPGAGRQGAWRRMLHAVLEPALLMALQLARDAACCMLSQPCMHTHKLTQRCHSAGPARLSFLLPPDRHSVERPSDQRVCARVARVGSRAAAATRLLPSRGLPAFHIPGGRAGGRWLCAAAAVGRAAPPPAALVLQGARRGGRCVSAYACVRVRAWQCMCSALRVRS